MSEIEQVPEEKNETVTEKKDDEVADGQKMNEKGGSDDKERIGNEEEEDAEEGDADEEIPGEEKSKKRGRDEEGEDKDEVNESERKEVKKDDEFYRLKTAASDALEGKSSGTTYKLYVGRTGQEMTEKELRKLFEEYGAVGEVVLLRNQFHAKGYGFVHMESKEDADAAIEALDGKHTCSGCMEPLIVKFASQGNTSRSSGSRQQQNRDHYGRRDSHGYRNNSSNNNNNNVFGPPPGYGYGAPPPAHAMYPAPMPMMGGMMHPQMPRQFMPPAPAPGYGQAMRPMPPPATGRGQMPGYPPAVVANPLPGYRAPPGAVVAPPPGLPSALFLIGFPDTTEDVHLYQLCAPFGNVVQAKVARDRNTGQSKGFGFVHFDNPASASAAVNALNGYDLGAGRKLTVDYKKE